MKLVLFFKNWNLFFYNCVRDMCNKMYGLLPKVELLFLKFLFANGLIASILTKFLGLDDTIRNQITTKFRCLFVMFVVPESHLDFADVCRAQ